MSDTFITTAFLPMSRLGFDAWLDCEISPHSHPTNLAAMYDGWFWDGSAAPESVPLETIGVCEWLRARALPAPFPMVCVYDAEAAAARLLIASLGYAATLTIESLLLAGAAGGHLAEQTGHAVVFAETSGQMHAKNILAVLELDGSTSRFVGGAPTETLVANYRATRDLWLSNDNGDSVLDGRLRCA